MRFAPSGESHFLPLYDDILRFASMGDITLIGDVGRDTQRAINTLNEYAEIRMQRSPQTKARQ